MNCFLYDDNQKGSLTLIALIFMVFFSILIAGLLPVITNTFVSATSNIDFIEAQYAAEAGAKRAVVGFQQKRLDWAWANGLPIKMSNSSTNKTYEVTITPQGSTPALTNGNAPAAGNYKITSVGKVGKDTKTISLNISVASSSNFGLIPNAALYIGGNFEGKNNISLNGNAILGGTLITHKPPTVTGQIKDKQKNLTFPQYDFESYKTNAEAINLPNQNQGGEITINLRGKKCYYDGNFTPDKNDFNFEGGEGSVLFINGNLDLKNNIKFNGKVLLIVNGYVDFKNNATLSNCILVATGDVTVKNGEQIGGAIVTPQSVYVKNNGNFNARADLANFFNSYMSSNNNENTNTGSVTISGWSDQNTH